MDKTYITIIGAGVIGLSCAYELSKANEDVLVLDKNSSFGQETSSRNSEVAHAGLYYQKGSLKAKSCVKGRDYLEHFCKDNNITFKRLGKVVVACNDQEINKIHSIYKNAVSCGVDGLRFLSSREINNMEPDIKVSESFLSESSSIVDTHNVMSCLYHKSKENGVTFSFLTEVINIEKKSDGYEITVKESNGNTFSFVSEVVINAAGLFADRVAEMVGIDIEKNSYKIHFCKGQYFRIKGADKFLIKHLIYPVPTDISLGIHITPDLGNGLRLGPDANYLKEIDYNVDENDKQKFLNSVKNFLPKLDVEQLIADTSGIRSKLQGKGEGFKDFVINHEENHGFSGFFNLIGIESPGFTAALYIGKLINNMV